MTTKLEQIADQLFNTPEDHFEDGWCGVCPECHQECLRNVGKNHYGCCDEHRVYWNIGKNLFSSWQLGSDEFWEENRKSLQSYTKVFPAHCTCEKCEPNHTKSRVDELQIAWGDADPDARRQFLGRALTQGESNELYYLLSCIVDRGEGHLSCAAIALGRAVFDEFKLALSMMIA